MSGAEIQANAFDTARRDFPLRGAGGTVDALLVVLMGLAAPLLNMRMAPMRALPIVGAIAAAFPGTTGAGGVDRAALGRAVLGDPATGQPFEQPGVAAQIGTAAMKRGLITYPGSGAADGRRGDHLLLGPPLSITAAEVDEMLELLEAALQDVLG